VVAFPPRRWCATVMGTGNFLFGGFVLPMVMVKYLIVFEAKL